MPGSQLADRFLGVDKELAHMPGGQKTLSGFFCCCCLHFKNPDSLYVSPEPR